ncbi:MAG: methylated-DNA--[protein]-cysteine S-methyltransferase [Lentimicrobiaceae bacterium]|jgi:methylated-DNA-[protein]-cysteine S-methyltransferase|nr:methylated-DNA--[protein]-cysteine S-methyltransferase [Lentimicrobiaceae bacterium]MCP4910135.1 methylated-DNA--[protein]-cysteine S-methyltransferase [Bacteroidota bacterium]MBT3454812.1 methylated-DNA--[protein]-cysteine S-methyltransferase [Lentimicrobiaceae bacterium]MBT3817811.1 methylated-DNA--[protein]-cysteine S-methyltransferase [Lentimicrobiaceae bacterium]MBT4061160.1 methylated-DNA--[protein]-cysteine S-methyltransferase [Lentimicrobiaceae bacterium]
MEDINIAYYKSPYGELIIGDYYDRLCLCDWRYRKMRSTIDKRTRIFFGSDYVENLTPVIGETIKQLEQYFNGERKEFELPLNFAGTPFQVEVWEQLLKIPWGETATYQDISNDIGNPDATRAVASTNGANSIAIIVPCHRVIGSNKKLVGYAGGLNVKKKLLKLENIILDPQLDMFDI